MTSHLREALRGFTLVEVLVAMTLMGIVVAGTLQALSAQKKFYARQARILDARHAMRASAAILSSELREANSSGGDLYSISANSIAMRSTVGFAVACSVDVARRTISVIHTSGHFRLEGADSLLLFVEGGARNDDDAWGERAVTGISAFGPRCASGQSAERVLSVAGDVSGVWIGSPVRFFRPYEFGLFQTQGRWWLGRKNRAAGFNYVPVAGPLAPPADNGLAFTYFDEFGGGTSDPTQVVRVEISVRAPTFRSLTDPAYQDMSTSTYLRNGE